MPAPLPKLEEDLASIVLVGSFNPVIFQPAWFAHQGLISESEAASDFGLLMARVREGAEVIIERDAKPVAVVRPAAPVSSLRRQDPAAGYPRRAQLFGVWLALVRPRARPKAAAAHLSPYLGVRVMTMQTCAERAQQRKAPLAHPKPTALTQEGCA